MFVCARLPHPCSGGVLPFFYRLAQQKIDVCALKTRLLSIHADVIICTSSLFCVLTACAVVEAMKPPTLFYLLAAAPSSTCTLTLALKIQQFPQLRSFHQHMFLEMRLLESARQPHEAWHNNIASLTLLSGPGQFSAPRFVEPRTCTKIAYLLLLLHISCLCCAMLCSVCILHYTFRWRER
jgi:hypothetical protein